MSNRTSIRIDRVRVHTPAAMEHSAKHVVGQLETALGRALADRGLSAGVGQSRQRVDIELSASLLDPSASRAIAQTIARALRNGRDVE